MNQTELLQAGIDALNRGNPAAARGAFSLALQSRPGWPPAAYGLGVAYFHLADYAGALPLLQQAVSLGIGMPESWRFACHALAMLGRDAELVQALALPAAPVQKAQLCFQICNNRLAQKAGSSLPALVAGLPDEPALKMAGEFWLGVVLATMDDVASTRWFRSALGHAAHLRRAGDDPAVIASHISAGASLDTDAFVLDDAGDWGIAGPDLIMLRDPPVADTATGIVLVAADMAYVVAFADDCAQSLAALGPGWVLHIHILDPTAETEAVLAQLADAYPGLTLVVSTETRIAPGDAVYYSCARFLVLPLLLARYDRDIWVADIDSLFRPDFARLSGSSKVVDAPNLVDFALFEVDTVYPWLKAAAALVLCRNTPGGRVAAALTDRFLRRKLAQARNWTLDQAALFCVRRAIARHRPDISLGDLRQMFGRPMTEIIAGQGSFAQKRALRLETAQKPAGYKAP